MKQKKIDKLTKLIDPEPHDCMGVKCGFERIAERTGTVYDVLAETQWVPAPRNNLYDYKQHLVGCPWGAWAIRELTRRMN